MVLWGMGLQRSTVWVVCPMLKWDVGNDLFFVRTPLWNRIRRVGVLEHERFGGFFGTRTKPLLWEGFDAVQGFSAFRSGRNKKIHGVNVNSPFSKKLLLARNFLSSAPVLQS